jgi:hypothetical protein
MFYILYRISGRYFTTKHYTLCRYMTTALPSLHWDYKTIAIRLHKLKNLLITNRSFIEPIHLNSTFHNFNNYILYKNFFNIKQLSFTLTYINTFIINTLTYIPYYKIHRIDRYIVINNTQYNPDYLPTYQYQH